MFSFVNFLTGASAQGSPNISLDREVEVGKNLSMTIPEDIAGEFSFRIRYTPSNSSSNIVALCTYLDGSLKTANPDNPYHQGVSCIPNGVFISSAKPHHAGTYSIALYFAESELVVAFSLSITGQ